MDGDFEDLLSSYSVKSAGLTSILDIFVLSILARAYSTKPREIWLILP